MCRQGGFSHLLCLSFHLYCACVWQIEWYLEVNIKSCEKQEKENRLTGMASMNIWWLFSPVLSSSPYLSFPALCGWGHITCGSWQINQSSSRDHKRTSALLWRWSSGVLPWCMSTKSLLVLASLVECHRKCGVVSSVASSCFILQPLHFHCTYFIVKNYKIPMD
jgi:hypothetical protein